MGFPGTGKIWMNGKFVDWKDATIHVASHVIHYGSGVFEGARCYDTKKGSAVLRLDSHIKRLLASAKIYRMESPFTPQQLETAVLDTIRANGFKACYIRPLMYRGYNTLGVNPLPNPVDVAVMVWEWGTYLGADALEQGVDVCVSSWNRMAPNTFPSLSKTSGNYANAALIRMEAESNGYSEGIALDTFGYVSEGSGENIFLVRDGKIYTPPLSASILPGITREMIVQIAQDLGYSVSQENIPREMLYIADEVFFVGTAVEITPIRSVDKIVVGSGRRGPITEAIQRQFLGVINGDLPDTHKWLTYLDRAPASPEPVGAGSSKAR
jgi:branched-chain amino acid aminotransferase